MEMKTIKSILKKDKSRFYAYRYIHVHLYKTGDHFLVSNQAKEKLRNI